MSERELPHGYEDPFEWSVECENRADKAEQQRDDIASDLETAVLKLRKAERERDGLRDSESIYCEVAEQFAPHGS